jgi:hypothetical protein
MEGLFMTKQNDTKTLSDRRFNAIKAIEKLNLIEIQRHEIVEELPSYIKQAYTERCEGNV